MLPENFTEIKVQKIFGKWIAFFRLGNVWCCPDVVRGLSIVGESVEDILGQSIEGSNLMSGTSPRAILKKVDRLLDT